VQKCWDNAFCNFSAPVGTSLICIQGPWSNVADAKIKSGIAAQAVRAGSTVYNPLYARASQMPQPWGVTVLCAEHTGSHPPIDVDWSLEPRVRAIDPGPGENVVEIALASRIETAGDRPPAPPTPFPSTRPTDKRALFENFWDLALAINRSDAGALDVAQNGANAGVRVDPTDLRKLLGTVWFRSVFPRLSNAWREHLLSVLVETVVIPDHVLKLGRREIRIRDIGLAELKELFSKSSLNEAVRGDVRLLLAVGNLWGAESRSRIHFAGAPAPEVTSKLALMMQGFRRV
jgi:hypothetical protein